eukprot:CAMPEP_0198109742 /NCGR_PEP_ID=MMETSP1442-20131203/1798_1 /TAXON_ID= /ORGANISM="Craspedostauros australis, Strain CCMP3328" /LENGTH=61 /DNA_ID=CAMNT_0043765531 /DNA_START=407 /DNA_END=589 /DNA_ORIENTATION=-
MMMMPSWDNCGAQPDSQPTTKLTRLTKEREAVHPTAAKVQRKSATQMAFVGGGAKKGEGEA